MRLCLRGGLHPVIRCNVPGAIGYCVLLPRTWLTSNSANIAAKLGPLEQSFARTSGSVSAPGACNEEFVQASTIT